MVKKKKLGRPKTGGKFTNRFMVSITDETFAMLCALAEDRGCSVSQAARTVLAKKTLEYLNDQEITPK